ncbi:hypothetical protein JI664_21420 [Rhodobacter sp. NTK016B]|uniref:pyocin knob domain-containing protein n=1 Tax=Rhodobacter sp. NTK016B TaxID=2759676 RepID=UPI001A8EF08B|nr:pyocin knob domain-containing protein [Rhodobacter sp. NTK016B]MBN8294547.1 hypothetical protein [Rhodobacter sp. NTK016B]
MNERVRVGDRLKSGGLDDEILAFAIDGNGDATVTLATTYEGAAITGQPFSIQPTPGFQQALVTSLNAYLAAVKGHEDGPLSGKWPDGAAAAPSFAFANDIDTGIFRPDANQIGFVTAAATRALLKDDSFEITVPITGSAVTSNALDATVGRLMKVGDFGLGGTAISLTDSDDLDDISASGFYYNATAGNTPGNNYPVSSAGSLLVIYQNPSRCVQYYTLYGTGEPQTYVRSKGGTTWTAWRAILPERGSNGNGQYTRFADGTQICWHEIDDTATAWATAQSSLYTRASAVTWTYPASFASDPLVLCTAHIGNEWVMGCRPRSAPANNSVSLLPWATGAAGPTTAKTIFAMAIGRWF